MTSEPLLRNPGCLSDKDSGKGPTYMGVISGTYQGVRFDATTIDSTSLRLAEAPDLGIGKSPQDINGDRDMDMVFHFDTQLLKLTADSTQAVLAGKTVGNIYFTASDSVRIVPAK